MKMISNEETEEPQKRSRRRYDEETKQEILKLILNGHPISALARDFGIHENVLYKWKKEERVEQTPSEAEVERLRTRLRQVEMERDILKKALSIFSRQT